MITVEVTSTNYIVSATEISYDFTVSADDYLFTVTTVTPNFTVTNVTPEFTFSAEASGFEFANKFLGDWISGETYYRNDVVQYEYSTYICQVDALTSVTSTTPPPQDSTNWILFIHNEWPRAYLTITNWLNVGTTATFNNLEVGSNSSTGTFSINGLQYPTNKGVYGQVLYTNGDTNAAWVNLGELTFWELSEDLQTEGFNIVTDAALGDPNPQLTIGSGSTGAGNNTSTFKSFIKFDSVPYGATLGTIKVKGDTLFYSPVTVGNSLQVAGASILDGELVVNNTALFNSPASALDAFSVGGTFIANSSTVHNGTTEFNGATQFDAQATFNNDAVFQDQATFNAQSSFNGNALFSTASVRYNLTIHPDAVLRSGYTFSDGAQLINVASGFRFPDGTEQISASISTGTVLSLVKGGVGITTSSNGVYVTVSLLTATNSVIGGVIPGDYTTLNTYTGALSVNQATTTSYGAVKIGEGLRLGGSPYDDAKFLQIERASPYQIGGIVVGAGFDFNTDTGLMNLIGATTSTIGGVKVGDYLSINDSVLTVNTSTLGPALGSLAYTLPIATDVILGGIKVGEYLSINTTTGVLTVNTASLAPALIDITLPIASAAHLGGVRIPSGGIIQIDAGNGDITVPYATTTTGGVVKVGSALEIDGSGFLDAKIATAGSLGVVQAGNGLDIDINGILSVNTVSTQMGNISLSQDMETNGYKIQKSVGSLSYIDIDDTVTLNGSGGQQLTFSGNDVTLRASNISNNVELGSDTARVKANDSSFVEIYDQVAKLQANTQTYVSATGTSVVIATLNTSSGQVLVKTAEMIVGVDIYNSQIQASAYYDYAGTGAAFFPANIKFSDDTIQRTAWRGYDQGLI